MTTTITTIDARVYIGVLVEVVRVNGDAWVVEEEGSRELVRETLSAPCRMRLGPGTEVLVKGGFVIRNAKTEQADVVVFPEEMIPEALRDRCERLA
jgi:hypothetical protein